MKRLCLVIILLAASVGPVPALPTQAAPDLGGEFVISAKADQQQRTLDATWHAATGQFLIVWSEHPDHSTNGGEFHSGDDAIRGQLVNLDSTLAGGDFLISEAGDSKDFPQVAHVGNTNDPAEQLSLVVWMDDRDGGDDIWAQLIAPAGNALQGANFKLSGADADLFPKLTYGQIDASNGRFLVVWERETAAGESEVYGQLVRGATTTGSPGDLVGGNFQISDSTAGRAASPGVAFDPVNDQFLVVWSDARGGPNDERQIWGQLLNSSGSDVGGNFLISDESGYEYAPGVLYHPEMAEYLVLWNRSTPTFLDESDVHARRVSAAGALLGARIDVAATADQEEFGNVAIDVDTGSYVIPLTTGPTIVARTKVEVVKLNSAGVLVGAREQVATDDAANKGPSAAVYGSTPIGPGAGVAAVSEVLIVWRDSRSAADPDDLLAQDIYARTAEVLSDTDGDGLLDNWETGGFVDMNDNGVLDAGDFDFSTLPAANQPDVNHKDLYVEADWMSVDADNDGITNGDPDQPGDHDHAPIAIAGSLPTGTNLDTVITAFANAPVANPDGINGINLHVDIGQMGGGGPIAETAGVDFFAGFEGVKAANFAASRARVFRYGLFKHEGSGRGEIWGNDFWAGGGSNTQVLQAVTFMHEFGHTLGLRHGGGDNTNCEPNYFSIMSYTHSNTGIPPTFRFDYSFQLLPTLNEAALNEGLTLGDGNDQTMFSAGGAAVGPNAQTAGNVPIDWDNDGIPGEVGGAVGNNNINNLAVCAPTPANEMLTSFNDWANLRYNWRSSPHVDDNVHSFHEEEDVTDAGKDFFRDQYGAPSLSLTKTGTASGIPGDPVAYDLLVENAGPGPARNVVIVDTWPAGLTFTGSSFPPAVNVLNVDGSRTLEWHFDPILSGDAVTVMLDGTIDFPPAADAVTNSVAATGQNVLGEPQPALVDDLLTDIQFPEFEASKTATPAVNAGEAIVYTLTYENVGDADAAGMVIVDTLPSDVYYSLALDLGAGPQPDSVTSNADGTTALTWLVGDVPAGSGPTVIEYTARPSLLLLEGDTVANDLVLDFSDANGNDYPALVLSAATTITAVLPTQDPRSLGFWRNHPELWSGEVLASLQATDDRFDGADGSPPDGALSAAEVQAALSPGGNMPTVLEEQLLATYFNLATQRINAGTAIVSQTAERLGLASVRDAALYAMDTLLLPVDRVNRERYSDANIVLDEINNNRSEVYP